MFKPNIVFYHCPCPDGLVSAYIAWDELGDDVIYVPFAYGMDLSPYRDCRPLFVDCCPEKEDAQYFPEGAVVLDHHESRKEVADYLWGLEDWDVWFDTAECGCTLTQQYFKRTEDTRINWLTHYGVIRDLWLKESDDWDHACLVAKGLMSIYDHDNPIKMFQKLHRTDFKELTARGEAVTAYESNLIDARVAAARPIKVEFAGPKIMFENVVVVENTAYPLNSDLGDRLGANDPDNPKLVVIWREVYDGEDTAYSYSLRGPGAKDLAGVMMKYHGGNGGGHPKAAGYKGDCWILNYGVED